MWRILLPLPVNSTAVFVKSQHYFETILKIPLIVPVFSDSFIPSPRHESVYNIAVRDGAPGLPYLRAIGQTGVFPG